MLLSAFQRYVFLSHHYLWISAQNRRLFLTHTWLMMRISFFFCCQETDSGVYTCLAASSSGETSWSGVLTVKGRLSLHALNSCRCEIHVVLDWNNALKMLHLYKLMVVNLKHLTLKLVTQAPCLFQPDIISQIKYSFHQFSSIHVKVQHWKIAVQVVLNLLT